MTGLVKTNEFILNSTIYEAHAYNNEKTCLLISYLHQSRELNLSNYSGCLQCYPWYDLGSEIFWKSMTMYFIVIHLLKLSSVSALLLISEFTFTVIMKDLMWVWRIAEFESVNKTLKAAGCQSIYTPVWLCNSNTLTVNCAWLIALVLYTSCHISLII